MSNNIKNNTTSLQEVLRIVKAKSTLPTEQYNLGYADGTAAGVVQGEKSAYDAFWDSAQNYGNARNYSYSFSGRCWTVDTFKPKYDIITTSASNMFNRSGITGSLSEILKAQGVELKLTTSTCENMFVLTLFTEIDLDASTVTNMNNAFLQSTKLATINLVLPTATTVSWYDTFYQCTSLIDLKLTGKIYSRKYDNTNYAISLAWSKKLNKESIINVIECLDESVTGQIITLSLTAVNNAFETSTGAADGSTSTEWQTLISTRSNWTINLLDK